MAEIKRRIQLINPALQLKLSVIFLALSLMSLVLHFTLVNMDIARLGAESGPYASLVVTEVSRILWQRFLLTAAIAVPVGICLGIVVTFRLAGPVYRFERHLKALAAGEDPGLCHIRKGDEFHRLCDLINDTTARVRAATAPGARATEGASAIAETREPVLG